MYRVPIREPSSHHLFRVCFLLISFSSSSSTTSSSSFFLSSSMRICSFLFSLFFFLFESSICNGVPCVETPVPTRMYQFGQGPIHQYKTTNLALNQIICIWYLSVLHSIVFISRKPSLNPVIFNAFELQQKHISLPHNDKIIWFDINS